MEFWVTIALGVFMLIMAVYGGYVSSKNRGQQIIFGVIGIICLSLLVWQSVLNRDSKKETDDTIKTLNTSISNQGKEISAIRKDNKELKLSIEEKERELTILNQKQLNLKQKELDLSYSISVDLIYNATKHQLEIYNRGKTNIYFWGTRLNNRYKDIMKEPRIITPNISTFYYIPTVDNLEKDIPKNFKPTETKYFPFDLFLKNEREERFVARFFLYIVRKDENFTIHTQNIGISKVDWSK